MSSTIINTSVRKTRIADLHQHPDNPRQGDVGAIAESIQQNGFYGTVVAQKSTGMILAGNHRVQAATMLGMTDIPVAWVDVDDEAARRILLADNRTNDLASYDQQVLSQILQELVQTDDGLAGTGYDGDDLDDLLNDLGMQKYDAEKDPEPTLAEQAQEKWRVETGDMWRIGDQMLICGDCTDESVWAGVDDADMMWTDPPYGVDYAGDVFEQARTKQPARKGIENDATDPQDLFMDMLDVVPLRKGAAVYVATPSGVNLKSFLDPLQDEGILRQILVWKKHRMTPGRSDYHNQHEFILYGWIPGAAHSWMSDRKQTTILEHDRPHASPEHPTMKPISLIAYCIKNNTKPGWSVIDPFSGSGSTLLACHETGRRGIGVELWPEYVAVTLQRFEDIGVAPERITA